MIKQNYVWMPGQIGSQPEHSSNLYQIWQHITFLTTKSSWLASLHSFRRSLKQMDISFHVCCAMCRMLQTTFILPPHADYVKYIRVLLFECLSVYNRGPENITWTMDSTKKLALNYSKNEISAQVIQFSAFRHSKS